MSQLITSKDKAPPNDHTRRDFLGLGALSMVSLAKLVMGADPEKIPATKLPVAVLPEDYVPVTREFLEESLGIKLPNELATVTTKNFVFHYTASTKEAKANKEAASQLADGFEAHLAFHAKLLFGEKDVTLIGPVDALVTNGDLTLKGLGKISGRYSYQQSTKEPKKFRFQLAAFNYGVSAEEFTNIVRHELLHALLSNRYAGLELAAWINEGVAYSTEQFRFRECKKAYLLGPIKKEDCFEKYSSATRIMTDLSDKKKDAKESDVANTMRSLLVNYLLSREEDPVKAWRLLGTFLDALNKEKVLGRGLSNDSRPGYEKALKDVYGISLKELDEGFDGYLSKLKIEPKEKPEEKKKDGQVSLAPPLCTVALKMRGLRNLKTFGADTQLACF